VGAQSFCGVTETVTVVASSKRTPPVNRTGAFRTRIA
jgi:hypothetical protein